MAREFSMQFPQQAFSVGQELAFRFGDKKSLLLVVKSIEGSVPIPKNRLVISFQLSIMFYSRKHERGAPRQSQYTLQRGVLTRNL